MAMAVAVAVGNGPWPMDIHADRYVESIVDRTVDLSIHMYRLAS